jgi:hypothetical protein
VEALTAVATVLAGAGITADAHRLAIDAEHIARGITDDYWRPRALTAVATALAAAGITADAERICVDLLLTTGWASIAPILVSLRTSREFDTDFTKRLVSGLIPNAFSGDSGIDSADGSSARLTTVPRARP